MSFTAKKPHRRSLRPMQSVMAMEASQVWYKVAGASGIAAVALGAYGAHMFKPDNEAYKEVWKTANLYHLVHSGALLATPLVKRPHVVWKTANLYHLLHSGAMFATPLVKRPHVLSGPKRVSPRYNESIPCEGCDGRGWLVCNFCKGQCVNVQVRSNKFYRRCPECKAVGRVLCGECRMFKCVTFDDSATVTEDA
eukprot:TRINITY_DN177_c0_g2_i1.p1 TRINITY_DN177_c0_g2~~TRINITY_DN177_c0_g2_i1.p1  ORF type:complete len:195 (-),score=8.05 TRINITY_DN177_c0_g2_i1:361-945(-)